MKLHGSTKNKITKDEDGANVPHLGITKVVLMHYNIINNHYQQDSRVLYPFVLNKSSGHSLDISPKKTFKRYLKTFDSEFSYIELWFTDINR